MDDLALSILKARLPGLRTYLPGGFPAFGRVDGIDIDEGKPDTLGHETTNGRLSRRHEAAQNHAFHELSSKYHAQVTIKLMEKDDAVRFEVHAKTRAKKSRIVGPRGEALE